MIIDIDKDEAKKVVKDKSNKVNKADAACVGVGLLSGIGAFKVIKGIANTVVDTKNPIALTGLLVFEGVCVINAFAKGARAAEILKEVFEERLNKKDKDEEPVG